MTFKEDVKRIHAIEKQLNKYVGIGGRRVNGFNGAYTYWEYDRYAKWEEANPAEAEPLKEELKTLKEKWGDELIKYEAEREAKTKARKAKRYQQEVEELKERLNYLENWLKEYEKEV